MHEGGSYSPTVAALPTRTSRFFHALGNLIARRAKWVIVLWLIAGAVLTAVAPRWDLCCQDDDIHFLPAHCLSVKGYDLLEEAFPEEVHGSKLVIAFERASGALYPEDLHLIDRIVSSLEAAKQAQAQLGIRNIVSHQHPLLGPRLISEDGRASLIVVGMRTPFLAARTRLAVQQIETRIRSHIDPVGSLGQEDRKDLHVVLTGPAGMGRDLLDAAYTGFDATTWATVLLVILLSLLVYRAPFLALVPLLSISCAVWISLKLLSVCAAFGGLQLVNMTQVFVIVLLFGAGTDYCLFLISRYREELQGNESSCAALPRTLSAVGGALTASAGTVVCGLAMLGFAEFAKLRCTGPAVALSLVVGLLASLTLTPALLSIGGRWVFWPRHRPRTQSGPPLVFPRSTWLGRMLSFMARHPVRIWIGSFLALTPLALSGFFTTHSYGVCNELEASAPSRLGLDLIRDHFPPGEMSPLTILIPRADTWQSDRGLATIQRLTDALSAVPQVAEVRSLSWPLGDPEHWQDAERWAAMLASKVMKQHYLGTASEQSVTRLDVVFAIDPFSASSLETLRHVRHCLDRELVGQEGAPYALFNVTAIMQDVADIHDSDTIRINCLVVGSILLILLILVRRPVITLYLLLSIIFTYYVTLGLSSFLGPWLLGEAWGVLDWKVPFFLFTILLAVGEDYNIFLLSRILEERRHAPWAEATRKAVHQTGSTITSCGLIMAGTFATMLLGNVVSLRQMGLALAIGVLLDTFLVRLVLLPSFLFILGRKDRKVVAVESTRDTPVRRAA